MKTQMGGVIVGFPLDASGRKPIDICWQPHAFSGGKSAPTSAGFVSDLDGFFRRKAAARLLGAAGMLFERMAIFFPGALRSQNADVAPQDWRCFIRNLDRARYQPWVFYYPSGAWLDAVYFLLQTKLYELHRKCRLLKPYVVAHSGRTRFPRRHH